MKTKRKSGNTKNKGRTLDVNHGRKQSKIQPRIDDELLKEIDRIAKKRLVSRQAIMNRAFEMVVEELGELPEAYREASGE